MFSLNLRQKERIIDNKIIDCKIYTEKETSVKNKHDKIVNEWNVTET